MLSMFSCKLFCLCCTPILFYYLFIIIITILWYILCLFIPSCERCLCFRVIHIGVRIFILSASLTSPLFKFFDGLKIQSHQPMIIRQIMSTARRCNPITVFFFKSLPTKNFVTVRVNNTRIR